MAERIPGDRLKLIFGFDGRFKHMHVVKITETDKMAWMLHAQDCLDKYDDLRLCPYSHAQDNGLDEEVWADYKEQNVIVAISNEYGDLIPVSRMAPGETPQSIEAAHTITDEVEKDQEISHLLSLVNARVGEDFSIISHGDVGEPSNGALMKRLATIVEELWETSPTSPAT